jgi:hypothetical protein|tara:strand:- start:550 stop:777 length:228 start_codon:yes stop_codon:yes gene_type:complete
MKKDDNENHVFMCSITVIDAEKNKTIATINESRDELYSDFESIETLTDNIIEFYRRSYDKIKIEMSVGIKNGFNF